MGLQTRIRDIRMTKQHLNSSRCCGGSPAFEKVSIVIKGSWILDEACLNILHLRSALGVNFSAGLMP